MGERVLRLLDEAEAAFAGDPDRALLLAQEAVAAAETLRDRGDGLVLAAEICVRIDDSDERATSMLLQVPTEVDDALVRQREGYVWLELRDLAAAERCFRAALAVEPALADSYYGLGQILASRGDRAGAAAAWLETRRLDAAEPPRDWHLRPAEFEEIAERALAELPARAIELLANVPILIDDAPSPELIETGVDPRLLGLFSGLALTEKSVFAEQAPSVDSILLFQRNIERLCVDRDHLEEEIRITLLHETAHFFGLEDDDLDVLGLG